MSAARRAGGRALRRDILATLLPGFAGPYAPAWLVDLLEEGLGGVCLFGTNVVSEPQLRALTAAIRTANPVAVIAIDEEGGDVTRLFYDRGAPWPGNAILGRLDDLAVTEAVAREVGDALAAAGCTLTFAPDVDVNVDSDNPVIGVRSFGADPQLAARHSAAWVRGVQAAGVAASAKHFPGHGDTSSDSHLETPIVDVPLDVLDARELVPFRAAIAAGARTIMTSHILLPQLDAEFPATHSSRILHRLLRDELGFAGVIVSDALDMAGASGVHGIPEAAVRALAAGCDLLCIGTDNTAEQLEQIVAAIARAVDDGRLDADRVREAAIRVRALALSLPTPDDVDGDEPAALLPAIDADTVARTFDVSDAARARLAGAERLGSLVRIETEANIAVGIAPWGPFAASAALVEAGWHHAHRETLVPDGRLDAASLPGPVLVVGRDVHRHAGVRAALDALRAERDDVVVVDMGWPGDDRAYADIATFGASRLVGEALIGRIGTELGAARAGVA